MTKNLLAALVLAAVFTTLPAAVSEATPITGGLTIQGFAKRTDGGPDRWAQATGVYFFNGSLGGVSNATGVFSGLPPLPSYSFNNFSFASFVPVPSMVTLTSGSTYSFDLSTLAIALQITNHLILTGTGLLHAPGYDPTPASFTFESASGQKGEPPFTLTLAALDPDPNDPNSPTDPTSQALVSVHAPEPGSMLLLGTGLIGIAATARRRLRRRR